MLDAGIYFDLAQNATASRLGQMISEMACLVDHSQSAVVTIYEQWPEEEQAGESVSGAQGSLIHEGN